MHCGYTRELWSLVLCFFGLHWVILVSQLICCFLAFWMGKFAKHQSGGSWKSLRTFRGPFGESEIAELLKALNDLRKSLRCFFYILCMNGWLFYQANRVPICQSFLTVIIFLYFALSAPLVYWVISLFSIKLSI